MRSAVLPILAPVRPALVLLGAFSVITGIGYPAFVTLVAELTMPYEARGSLVLGERSGPCDRGCARGATCVEGACREVLGSALVGQAFYDPRYFSSRPSATVVMPYDGAASTGSNRGPLHPALARDLEARVAVLRARDPGNDSPLPIDLVTTSASGLDPHVSPAAAYYEVPRIARLRGLDPAAVTRLVDAHVEGRTLGVLGEPRVNVLALNRALDRSSGVR